MKLYNDFEKKVCSFITKNKLLKKGDKVLVCLSGGADSVCLLRVMCKLKDELDLTIHAAHVNHMLRGSDADSDEMFCKTMCEQLSIELHVLKKDVHALAKETKQSIEAVARNVRYEYFFSLKSEFDLDVIITAHNQNDNAETSFMYYLRGSGLDGIKGILPYREDGLIRPLLCVSRAEIEEYLAGISQGFVTDKTNFEDVYMRNKIRLNLIPELEEKYNPNLIKVISENALLLGADALYLNKEAKRLFDAMVFVCKNGFYLNVFDYKKTDKALAFRVLRLAIAKLKGSDKDISYSTIMRLDDLFSDGEGAKKVSVAYGYFARREYDRVYFEALTSQKNEYCYKVAAGEKIYIKEADMTFSLSLTKEAGIRSKNCEYFDYNSMRGQIYIRSRKNGDSFMPFNMKGTKKLKDFFIDEKIASSVRAVLPLVTCGDDILWVCGYRRSNLYKANKESEKILKIEFWEGK